MSATYELAFACKNMNEAITENCWNCRQIHSAFVYLSQMKRSLSIVI